MGYDWGRGLSQGAAGAAAGSWGGPIGSVIGGVGGLLGGFGGSSPGHIESSLNQVPGAIKNYYRPYQKAGEKALPNYQEVMRQMLTDPQKFLAALGSGYKESPGFQWKLGQGESAINNAQASGGMLGSPQHQQEAGELANNLASQDYNEYMQRILQTLGMGQQGTAGLIGQGAASSGELATSIANALGAKSSLRYANEANRNQQQSGLWGNVLGFLGNKYGQGNAGNAAPGLPVPWAGS